MPGRSYVKAGADYRFGFNGKEQDPEGMGGGGSTYDYGFRIYNPQLGKFLSIDPLFKAYADLTPYQFAANMPIAAIDLDGLEADLAIYGSDEEGSLTTYYTSSDINAFQARALLLHNSCNYEPVMVASGGQLIDVLKEATTNEGSISNIVIFAHGVNYGVVLDAENGFYTSQFTASGSNQANVGDLSSAMNSGEVVFESNAIVCFATCNANGGGTDYDIAQNMTKITGVTTVGATSQVEPEIIDGVETGRLVATYGTFIKYEVVSYTASVFSSNGDLMQRTFKSESLAERFASHHSGREGVAGISIEANIKTTDLGNTIDPSNL